MVSEEGNKVLRGILEESARVDSFLNDPLTILANEVDVNGSALEKAMTYEGKRIVHFHIDCLPDSADNHPDITLGFRDATLQVFGTTANYRGEHIPTRRLIGVAETGLYLKKVRAGTISLYNEDAGEFMLNYQEMAITRPLQRQDTETWR